MRHPFRYAPLVAMLACSPDLSGQWTGACTVDDDGGYRYDLAITIDADEKGALSGSAEVTAEDSTLPNETDASGTRDKDAVKLDLVVAEEALTTTWSLDGTFVAGEKSDDPDVISGSCARERIQGASRSSAEGTFEIERSPS